MATRHRRAGKVGRPPTGRRRQTFVPTVDADLYADIEALAGAVGLLPSQYTERVMGLAHGYASPYLPDLPAPLPLYTTVGYLQEVVARLGSEDCPPPPTGPRQRFQTKIDVQLAGVITARCDVLDVDYASYIRAVLGAAAGRNGGVVRPRQERAELVVTEGGALELAAAS